MRLLIGVIFAVAVSGAAAGLLERSQSPNLDARRLLELVESYDRYRVEKVEDSSSNERVFERLLSPNKIHLKLDDRRLLKLTEPYDRYRGERDEDSSSDERVLKRLLSPNKRHPNLDARRLLELIESYHRYRAKSENTLDRKSDISRSGPGSSKWERDEESSSSEASSGESSGDEHSIEKSSSSEESSEESSGDESSSDESSFDGDTLQNKLAQIWKIWKKGRTRQ